MRTFLTGLVAGALAVCAGYALASRNSSGTMSAVNGPYIAGTPISSSIVNARLADIENELTDSLSRSGRGGMTAALKEADGTVAAPSFSFTNEAGTGLYRIGATDVGFAIAGVKKLELTSALFTVVPAASFSSTADVVGNFSVATNKFNVTAATGNTLVAGTLGVSGIVTAGAGSGGLRVTGGNQNSINFRDASNTTDKWLVGRSFASDNAQDFFVYDAATTTRVIGIDSADKTTLYGAGAVVGDFSVNTNKFTVTASNGNTAVAGTLGVTGATTLGPSGTATTQMNFGACTLDGGTPSKCTATVAASAKCVATHVGTSATSDAVLVNLVTTTLTVTSSAGRTNAVNYVCF